MTPVIPCEAFEISPRFRLSLERRIAQLEADAVRDEAAIAQLGNADHIQRQVRLVVAQRTEALRMRLFLDRARHRSPEIDSLR